MKAAIQTGDYSSAATWGTVAATPTFHATTNITVTAGGVFTDPWTAPNTTNDVVRGEFMLTGVGTGAVSLVFTLQESTVDTVSTVTVPISQLTNGTRFSVTFPTYTYTTTSSNAYRMKVARTGGAGIVSLAASSGGTLVWTYPIDNRTGVPATNEDFDIIDDDSTGTSITVTLTGTSNEAGSGTHTAPATVGPRVTGLCFIGSGGKLEHSPSQTTRFTYHSNLYFGVNGQYEDGTTGTPLSSSYTHTMLASMATSATIGLTFAATAIHSIQGNPIIDRTILVSGVGTAASPIITSTSVDWNVGNEIHFPPNSNNATNYNETEVRYIITKNSATSYVLSSTVGGSENALVNVHTGVEIYNATRNIVFDSDNTGRYFLFNTVARTTTVGSDIDYVQFKTGAPTAASNCLIDNCSNFNGNAGGMFNITSTVVGQTFSKLLALDGNGGGGSSGSVIVTSNARSIILEDCVAVDNLINGFRITNSFGVTLRRCKAFAGARSSAASGAFRFQGSTGCMMFDCEANGNRGPAIQLENGQDIRANNSSLGLNASNGSNISAGTTFNTAVFTDCLFQSGSFLTGYLTMLDGSVVAFHRINQTENNHTWYTNYGSARSTGASLVDTVTRTVGNLALRISPEELTTGFTWQFKVLARANSGVVVQGFAQKNAAFGSDVATIALTLPGSGTPVSTFTVTNTPDVWEQFVVSGNYTGIVDAYATVTVTGMTATPSAYLRIADIFNGTNSITGLRVWDDGQPSTIMFEQLGDMQANANAVWSYLLTNAAFSTTGTVGYMMTKMFKFVQFILVKVLKL